MGVLRGLAQPPGQRAAGEGAAGEPRSSISVAAPLCLGGVRSSEIETHETSSPVQELCTGEGPLRTGPRAAGGGADESQVPQISLPQIPPHLLLCSPGPETPPPPGATDI